MDTTYTILCRGDRGAALCKLPAAPALPACGSKIYLAPSAISHQHNKTSVSLRLQIHQETCSAKQSINFVLHELKGPLAVTHFSFHSQYPLKQGCEFTSQEAEQSFDCKSRFIADDEIRNEERG
jgi:hypothetical protein